MSVLISVIIPIYNVESYLAQCLDSILGQSYKNIEVICIDDGSTDSSGAIAQKYASKDPRIHFFTQANTGAGAARNAGLKQAKGEYILCFDADDYMRQDTLALLQEQATSTNADITIASSQSLDDSLGILAPQPEWLRLDLIQDYKTFSHCDLPSDIFGFCVGWAWDKLYRRSFIQEHSLAFHNLPVSNDLFFVFMSLVYARKIACVPQTLFTHRINVKNSIESSRDKHPLVFIQAIHKWQQALIQSGVYPTLEQSYATWVLNYCLWHLRTLSTQEAKKSAYNALHSYGLRQLGLLRVPRSCFPLALYQKLLYIRFIPYSLHRHNLAQNIGFKSLLKSLFRLHISRNYIVIRFFGKTLYQSAPKA